MKTVQVVGWVWYIDRTGGGLLAVVYREVGRMFVVKWSEFLSYKCCTFEFSCLFIVCLFLFVSDYLDCKLFRAGFKSTFRLKAFY